jgi:large subunit ribosomal protein L29
MAVGTKDLASENLRGFEDDRLVDELKKAKEELFNLRFQSATGQLDNHGRLRAVRKDIARIYTEMRERELGIGMPPGQSVAAHVEAEQSAKRSTSDSKAEKKADKKSKKDEKAEDEA